MWKLGIVRCNMSIYLVSLFCKCRMILVNLSSGQGSNL